MPYCRSLPGGHYPAYWRRVDSRSPRNSAHDSPHLPAAQCWAAIWIAPWATVKTAAGGDGVRASGDCPLIHARQARRPSHIDVALGPSARETHFRGYARGIVAVGDVATGVLAFGGVAIGGHAVGELGVELVAIGGVALGLLAAGGPALGLMAIGGLATGASAVGGIAVGYLAVGGGGYQPVRAGWECWLG